MLYSVYKERHSITHYIVFVISIPFTTIVAVNVNAIDKDINGERRERERELMRSNSERDRSTNSHPRELASSRDVNDQRDTNLAKYSCRGEVRPNNHLKYINPYSIS